MTDSNATTKRNIVCDLPDYPDGVITFDLVTHFAANDTEGFPQKSYSLTLSATGTGTQALPVPSSDAWLWEIGLPDGNKPKATLAAGADLQLTTWLASALSTETAASLEDSFVLKAGDTMTGLLTLSGAPTADLHAATKLYVDENAGGAGGMAAATYDPAAIEEQLVGLTATQTLTNKDITDFTNDIDADDVHVQVRNESGVTLAKGTPVYTSGYSVGQEIALVSPADASSAATMPAIGLLAEELLNNATGGCIIIGREEGIDTSAFSAGDELYVSETAGELTATKPTGTALIQPIATVLRVHATLGVLQISNAAAEGLPNLPEDNIWVGNASGVPTETTPANALTALGAAAASDLTTHTGNTSNPHSVTAAQVDAIPKDAAILSKSATYEVAAGDDCKIIECSGTFTVTFPNGLDTGFQVTVVNVGAGVITLSAATTLQGEGTQLATQYTGAVVYHRGSNVWLAMGKLT